MSIEDFSASGEGKTVPPVGKILVLGNQDGAHDTLISLLRSAAEIKEISSIDEAVEALRRDYYDAIFSDTADFLPLERALVKQQASLILNTLGEGVCIVDPEGRCAWSNRRMQDWPARVHENIRRTCLDAFEWFKQPQPPSPAGGEGATTNRSRRYTLNLDDQRFFELVASPVVNPAGQVVQVVAVIWDATPSRRLQQKIDAIDRAGRELMRMEAEAIGKMHISDRLKLLEEKVIRFARELLHFDHFIIRVLDPKTRKLELVISVGLPEEAKQVELYASPESNGISGHVAATGKSYLCPDVEHDPRYVMGLDHAKSSLTVPLFLFDDKVIGVFNIESRQKAAFTEDDRQIAEIFGHYIAVALHMFNLLINENASVRHRVAEDLSAELAEPLNDICADSRALMDQYVENEPLYLKLQTILENAERVRREMRPTAEGTNAVLGAAREKGGDDPAISGAQILVADDNESMREMIADILRKYGAEVTIASCGLEAIEHLGRQEYDLVISDIRMPDRNGYQVFQAARNRRAGTPVILTTAFGHDSEHCIIDASREGLEAVLYKPFRAAAMLASVRKALATRVKQV
jgi:two-component system, sensor histidine kinase SagS